MWTCFQHGPKHENYNGFPNHPKVAEASYSGSLGGEAGGLAQDGLALNLRFFCGKFWMGRSCF